MKTWEIVLLIIAGVLFLFFVLSAAFLIGGASQSPALESTRMLVP